MARPRKPGVVAVKPSLRLYPGEDDDLIEYLDQATADGASLAQAVIAAMRGGMTAVVEESAADEEAAAAALDDLFF